MIKKEFKLFIGIILIIAGVAAAAYGVITYNSLQNDLANRVVKAFSGSSESETQSLFIAIAGSIITIAGIVVVFSGTKRKVKKKRRR